jgi:hypothetical protein
MALEFRTLKALLDEATRWGVDTGTAGTPARPA